MTLLNKANNSCRLETILHSRTPPRPSRHSASKLLFSVCQWAGNRQARCVFSRSVEGIHVSLCLCRDCYGRQGIGLCSLLVAEKKKANLKFFLNNIAELRWHIQFYGQQQS